MHFLKPLPGSISILDEASLAEVRDAVRVAGATVAMAQDALESCCIAASELCRNHLNYARFGEFYVATVKRGDVLGLELIARDQGAGIPNPTQAFHGGNRIQGSLGQGLAAVRRLMDEVDVDVRWGEGTCISARKFNGPVQHRSEIAILSRPYRSEAPSGDDALYARHQGRLLAVVADGLGHGPEARRASALTVQTAYKMATPNNLRNVPALCDEAMGTSTRGAVMALACLNYDMTAVQCLGVGNIVTQIYAGLGGSCVHAWSSAGTLGAGRRLHSMAEETIPLVPDSLIVMHSDGLKGCDVRTLSAWNRHHPIVVAHHLLTHYAVETDDSLVLVMR